MIKRCWAGAFWGLTSDGDELAAVPVPVTWLVCVLCALLGLSPVWAQESCVYREALFFSDNIDFSANMADEGIEIVPQVHLNATLFALNDGALVNESALSYHVDHQRRTMVVELDPSCGWSDGTPITAQDYLQGLRLLFTDEAKQAYIHSRLVLKGASGILAGDLPVSALGVRAIDTHRLEFDLIVPPEKLKDSLNHVSMTPAPSHLLSRDPKAWPVKTLNRVSSGSMAFVSQDEEKITLKRNAYYCTGSGVTPGPVTQMEYALQRHDSAINRQVKLFSTGVVDFVPTLGPSELRALLKERPQSNLIYPNEQAGRYLLLSGQLRDRPKLREAVLLAIDHKHLLERVTRRKHIVKSKESLNFSYPGYRPPRYSGDFVLPYATRLAKAKATMQALGYSEQNPLRLTLSEMLDDGLSLPIRSMLSQIHIELNLVQVETLQEGFASDLFYITWFYEGGEPSVTLFALSEHVVDRYPEILAGLKQTDQIFDQDERYRALEKLERQLIETRRVFPLDQLDAPMVFAENITIRTGLAPSAIDRIQRSDCPS